MAKPISVGRKRYRIKFQPKGIYKASFSGSYAECLAWHAQQVVAQQKPQETDDPVPVALKSGTVRELIELYRRDIAEQLSAKHTGRTLNGFLATADFVDQPATSVTEANIQAWFNARLRMLKRGGKLLRPSTVLFELGTWRRIFRIGCRQGLCGLTRQSLNPALDIEIPKRNSEGRPVRMLPRQRVLEGDEFKRLLASCRDGYPPTTNPLYRHMGCDLEDIVIFAYLTGMRRSEILKLKVGDVTEKIAKLKLTKNGDDQSRALVPELWPWLRKYLTDRAEWEQRSLRQDEPMFPWRSSLENLSTQFQRACKRAGIEGLQFRDLRADFCTRTNDRTGDPLVTIRFTGHTSTRVFERHYYRKTPEQAADMLRPAR